MLKKVNKVLNSYELFSNQKNIYEKKTKNQFNINLKLLGQLLSKKL